MPRGQFKTGFERKAVLEWPLGTYITERGDLVRRVLDFLGITKSSGGSPATNAAIGGLLALIVVLAVVFFLA